MDRCPLMVPVRLHRDDCDWCGVALAGRARRWCPEHRYVWASNHCWTWARDAVKRAASVSPTCPAEPYVPHGPYACRRCSGVFARIEVNHITPVLGRHAENGCHHHLDGLEALCHDCHVIVTRAQRAAGWTAVEAPALALQSPLF